MENIAELIKWVSFGLALLVVLVLVVYIISRVATLGVLRSKQQMRQLQKAEANDRTKPYRSKENGL